MTRMEEFYKDKAILVTGGSGFIGSHLTEKLVKLQAKVTILDNFTNSTLSNLKDVLPYITIIYGDIRSLSLVRKAARNKDIIFHLAALTSVPDSILFPEFCYEINVQGTENLLKAAVENKVYSFIFSSSAAVYGSKAGKCKETDQLTPISPYGKSKLEGESLCKKYYQKYQLNCAALRYFNVYGERQNPKNHYAAVVAKFKYNLLNQKPIIIYGDGTQTRDFIHVSQVVDINLKIAMFPNLKAESFNVATGKSISLLQLLKKLEKETQKKPISLIFKPPREGDIKHSEASCLKLKSFKI